MSSRSASRHRRRVPIPIFIVLIAAFAVLGILMVDFRSIDSSSKLPIRKESPEIDILANATKGRVMDAKAGKTCTTVEEMGEIFSRGYEEESLRVRRIIHNHFALNEFVSAIRNRRALLAENHVNERDSLQLSSFRFRTVTNHGASRVSEFHPEEFCNHGFVIGKASEAGLGNELYKILTAAALSVMLNRSLIIGQTRGRYPFGNYISYSNVTFTLEEVKHLWRQNRCLTKYGRHLIMRLDDFQKPAKTGVLCSNWREWEQPIIWFQNTTDAVAAQFFLKNVHMEMRTAAFDLFGSPEKLQYRANVFGELMRIIMSPSKDVERAVNWALNGGRDPDIALHMRMMMNRSVRAKQAALDCIRKAIHNNLPMVSKPRVVLVSDTPSIVKDIAPSLEEFAEVLYFDYEMFDGNISSNNNKSKVLSFRVKDWGPAPRWVAFVDFFLASRAKHAVVSGAHRRVGTTYAQLIAALAAANRLDGKSSNNCSSITFLSSFQSNLLSDGLKNQVGWGHVWNRFAGPLSCQGQASQCALTPVLPPAWWDGLWQSPIPRDTRRMEAYGVKLSGFGTVDDGPLKTYCQSRKKLVVEIQLI